MRKLAGCASRELGSRSRSNPGVKRHSLPCDDARFINHSDSPNLWPNFTIDRYGVDIASFDIASGEQITIDYQLIEGGRP